MQTAYMLVDLVCYLVCKLCVSCDVGALCRGNIHGNMFSNTPCGEVPTSLSCLSWISCVLLDGDFVEHDPFEEYCKHSPISKSLPIT